MLAVTAYTLLKFTHVFLAIVAVGFNVSYAIWLARAGREPEHLGFALRGVRLLDERFANPAYGLLLVTGLAMVWVGDLDLTTFWIAAALVLYVVVAVLGIALYAPALRRQTRALEEHGPSSPEVQRLARRSNVVGVLTALPVIAIVFLMVTKPTL